MQRQQHLWLTVLALGIGLIAVTLLYALSWNQRTEIELVANLRATAQAEAERQRDTANIRQMTAVGRWVLYDAKTTKNGSLVATLLGVEALQRGGSFLEANQVVRGGLSLLPAEVARMQHDDSVIAVAFSPDGHQVVSGSWDGTARLWDVATGQEVVRMQHEDRVTAIDFSADGRLIATGSKDTTVRVWDAATGREIARMSHNDEVTTVAFSPDGRWVVSGSNDHTVRVWDVARRRELVRMSHDSTVSDVMFSPDVRWVISGSLDGTARVWDTATGREVSRTTVNYSVNSVAFHPDRRWVVSGSSGLLGRASALVWDAETGQEIARVTHDVYTVAFSPDGTYVVSAGCDHWTRTERVVVPTFCIQGSLHTRLSAYKALRGCGKQRPVAKLLVWILLTR